MATGIIKSQEAIEAIREGGVLLGEILSKVAKLARSGACTIELDECAETLIREAGGRPSFLHYGGSGRTPKYPATLCVSINDEVVHGVPKCDITLQEGDIVGFDIGMEWPCKKGRDGFYTDTALTVGVGKISAENSALLERTRASLFVGIRAVKPGAYISDVGRAVEMFLKPYSYGIVRDLVGHGVGYSVHEDPKIPNYFDARAAPVVIAPGMVLALEPMVTAGSHKVYTDADGWTIKTRDHSVAAHFEHTVIVTSEGCDIVTLRPHESVALLNSK